MRYWTCLALLVAAGGTAFAQVPPTPPTQPVDPNANPTDPAPTPTPTPTSPPAVPPPPAAPAPAADGAEHRPTEWSLAIGFGYDLPTSLQTPNAASVRLRLPSGLTFEPRLTAAKSTAEVDTGAATETQRNEVGAGALVRFPLIRRGRVDLEVLGGIDYNRDTTKPDPPDMDLTITVFSAVYGLAVSAWITRHWQISLTTLNPLVSRVRRDEEQGPGTSTVTTTTTFGLEFNPSVGLMVHLYH